MQCPKCLQHDVSLISNTHYVCNNKNCVNEDGTRTQFKYITDSYIRFPYNQIFMNRNKSEFYRKPYLELEAVGDSTTTR